MASIAGVTIFAAKIPCDVVGVVPLAVCETGATAAGLADAARVLFLNGSTRGTHEYAIAGRLLAHVGNCVCLGADAAGGNKEGFLM